LLQTLIEYWVKEALIESGAEIAKLIAAMPSFGRRRDVFRWLLLDEKLPGVRKISDFGDGSPLPVLSIMREYGKYNPSSKPSVTISILRSIFSHPNFRFGKSERQIIFTEGFQMGLPALDKIGFAKLPVRGRRWILEDRAFSQSALTADLYSSISSAPLACPDTQEAIQERTWNHNTLPAALRALRERNFGSLELAVLLKREDVGKFSDLMLASLRNRRNASTWYRKTDLSLPKGASLLLGRRLGNALAFFSLPIAKRLSVIMSLSREETQELKFDVSKANLFEAIWKCEEPSALKKARDIMLVDSDFRQSVFKYITRGVMSAQCFEIFVLNYMRETDVKGLQLLISRVPSSLRFWRPKMLGGATFREVIVGFCSTPDGFAALEAHGSARLIKCLFYDQDQWLRKWRIDLAIRASKVRVAKFRQRVRYHLIGSCPQVIGETIGWKISRADFVTLLTAVADDNELFSCPAILEFTEPSGQPCWERFFKDRKYGRKIRKLISSKRPELLPRLAELRAASLWKDKKFRKKLKDILQGKAPHDSLGECRLVQRKMIPWVRKNWRSKPTLAVAYELALAFSLRNSRYFVALCTTRWQSVEKDRGGHAFDHLYRTYSLPKKSGGSRLVTVPNDNLKHLQRRILRNGFDKVLMHSAAHGFKSGCSILTNATPHVGKACVVNVDIESFFPSTRYPLIFKACSQLMDGDLSEGARHVLADICSFDGGLPTGAPTSPAIANLVLRSADASIAKAAIDNGIAYTRYADDLTFSGETNTIKILPFVKRILTQLGYQLKEKKTNIFRRGRRQMVTGLVVNDKLNLPRYIRRRLRAAVHQKTKDGNPQWQGYPMSSQELLGRLAFLNLVQPHEAQALKLKMKGHK
jgi:retron-type reverse transcriptase